jgi:hypothetical protein
MTSQLRTFLLCERECDYFFGHFGSCLISLELDLKPKMNQKRFYSLDYRHLNIFAATDTNDLYIP